METPWTPYASWTQLADEVWEGCWNLSCVEKEFKLPPPKYEEDEGLCFDNGDCALVVDV